MEKKVIYVSPTLEKVEISQEGVLCSSDCTGGIDKLNETLDWSDDLWN